MSVEPASHRHLIQRVRHIMDQAQDPVGHLDHHLPAMHRLAARVVRDLRFLVDHILHRPVDRAVLVAHSSVCHLVHRLVMDPVDILWALWVPHI